MPACVPASDQALCELMQRQCGVVTVTDACGVERAPVCGACMGGEACVDGRCACLPASCQSLGLTCGSAPDDCGAILDCGSCPAPLTCGGGGVPSACGCMPRACGASCGSIDNGCGGQIQCSACPAGQSCVQGSCVAAQPGWVWENPLPHGYAQLAIWGDANGFWTAGDAGMVQRWQDGAWRLTPLPTDDQVIALSGTGPDDAWALSSAVDGGSSLWHWNGTTWTAAGAAAKWAETIWFADAQHGWVTAWMSSTRFWDGANWSIQDIWSGPHPAIVTAVALWGSGSSDVWGVGRDTIHWDGTAWIHYSANPYWLYGIHGTSADAVWAVGAEQRVRFWNGSTWTLQCHGGFGTPTLYDVWGTGPTAMWAVGAKGQVMTRTGGAGCGWSVADVAAAGVTLRAVWGRSSSDVVTVGDSNEVLQWNGANWTSLTGGVKHGTINDLWRDDSGRLWAAGTHGLVMERSPDGTWSRHQLGSNRMFTGIWARTPTDVWVVGTIQGATSTAALYHWNGNAWQSYSAGTQVLTDVWGAATNDVYAVGGTRVLHWNGAGWTEVKTSIYSLDRVWGLAADDVWAAGNGSWYHWDGVSWTSMPRPGAPSANPITGFGGRDALFAGTNLGVYHWDGLAWSPLPGAPYADAISVVNDQDIWVRRFDGTAGGALYHWDGSGWARQGSVRSAVNTVWAEQASVWVAGTNTNIVRIDR